jgi:hypothetical protein
MPAFRDKEILVEITSATFDNPFARLVFSLPEYTLTVGLTL